MTTEPDLDVIRQLARAAGLELARERAAAFGRALAELIALAEGLRSVDAGGAEPAAIFDPSWD